MKRLLLFVIVFSLILTSCSLNSEVRILAKLEKHLDKYTGYKTQLQMKITMNDKETALKKMQITLSFSYKKEDVEQIIDLELENLLGRARNMGLEVVISPEARRLLASMGYESKYGVRALRRTLIDKVEEPLSALIIERDLDAGANIEVVSEEEQIVVRVA